MHIFQITEHCITETFFFFAVVGLFNRKYEDIEYDLRSKLKGTALLFITRRIFHIEITNG